MMAKDLINSSVFSKPQLAINRQFARSLAREESKRKSKNFNPIFFTRNNHGFRPSQDTSNNNEIISSEAKITSKKIKLHKARIIEKSGLLGNQHLLSTLKKNKSRSNKTNSESLFKLDHLIGVKGRSSEHFVKSSPNRSGLRNQSLILNRRINSKKSVAGYSNSIDTIEYSLENHKSLSVQDLVNKDLNRPSKSRGFKRVRKSWQALLPHLNIYKNTIEFIKTDSEKKSRKWLEIQERQNSIGPIELSLNKHLMNVYIPENPLDAALFSSWYDWAHKIVFELFFLNTTEINVSAHEQVPVVWDVINYLKFASKLDSLLAASEARFNIKKTRFMGTLIRFIPIFYMYQSQKRINQIYHRMNSKGLVKK